MRAGDLQCLFQVPARGVKIPDAFVHLTPGAMQGITRVRLEVFCRIERARVKIQCFTIGIARGRVLCRALIIKQRAPGLAGFVKMPGEKGRKFVHAVGVRALQRFRNQPVQALAVVPHQ